MRCLYLLPFIAIGALQLPLSPHTHAGGPVYLQPIIRRARWWYILPHHSKRKNKQAPASHNYHTWQPCLVLYVVCFFTTKEGPYQDRPLLYPFHHFLSLLWSCFSPGSA